MTLPEISKLYPPIFSIVLGTIKFSKGNCAWVACAPIKTASPILRIVGGNVAISLIYAILSPSKLLPKTPILVYPRKHPNPNSSIFVLENP